MVIGFVTDTLKNYKLILEMSKSDFKTKYLGSYLGIIWAFVQPAVQILIFWWIFQVGFRNAPVDNFPFILWLSAAMIPWFFFTDTLQGGTHAITENSFLVKKVVFRVSILPIIKIFSSLYVHLFFIIFLTGMFALYGYYPDIYYLQIFYYTFCMIILLLGLTWLTSTLVVFLKDIGQIVSMVLQFGFWLTPIFYAISFVPEKYHFLYKYNPMFYVTEGYREALIYKKWFWQNPEGTIYFWLITLVIAVLGTILFKKMRPHFADVL